MPALAVVLAGCTFGAPGRTLPNGSAAIVVDTACAERLRPFLEALRSLRDGISDEMTYERFEERLSSVEAVYRSTPMKDLSDVCTEALAAPLELIYLEYSDTRIRWSLCRSDDDCDETQVREVLRTYWTELEGDLERVAFALP